MRRHAEVAFADWDPAARSGPTVFQWSACFPLLAVELLDGDLGAGLENARVMLEAFQQPLPEDVHDALTEAVEREDAATLAVAVERARALRYA